MSGQNSFELACPVPDSASDTGVVHLAHGGGGSKMNELIRDVFANAFLDVGLQVHKDAATIFAGRKIAFTTDTFVVKPPFFPGGDIGSLAVHGTINDLAMANAQPRYLSSAFTIEEGFSIEDLRKIVASMAEAAKRCHVSIVTGDTKVIERCGGPSTGSGSSSSNIFINTTGIGEMLFTGVPSPHSIRKGDAIILSGDIGRHGIAVMSVREGLEMTGVVSDSASLWPVVRILGTNEIPIRCMRDCTRGGLASSLVEIAEVSTCGMQIDESRIPVCPAVAGACEMLGLDPLHVANEGAFIAFVAPEDAEETVQLMRDIKQSEQAAIIGEVTDEVSARVIARTRFGTSRVIQMLSGEQLPRIC